MWVYCSTRDSKRPVRYFEYQPGRGGKYPETFLKGYTGYIHTDAYSGYNGVKGVTRCLCYTHLRRAFVDALPKDIHGPAASKPAEAVIRLNKLFEIEKELDGLPPEQKKKERLDREKPLLEAFWSWAEISSAGELPKSKLHTAFQYALNNRQEFFNYLGDGNCSISNSLAENCIRPFVIGRKNWLFAGSPKGAAASAGIYTLVETAKANGLDAKKYIKYRVTLSTTNTARTPTLTSISLYDNPKPLYTKLGYARPVILDSDGNVEAVLDNAYDIIVTSEINGVDELEFKLPFQDSKRAYIDNEKTVRIVSDTYRIRTITDDKEESGKAITTVYAEAAFYDLAYSVKKDEITFNADTADVPMAYALQGTDWDVGTVNVSTKRTWTCSEKNALAILRAVQNIHGGDLIFDNANRIVKLLTFSGEDSGVLFCYKKNMKSIQRVIDTTSLITRLYAYGKDGMTFASINGGNEYVQDTTEIRIATLDCSNFTNPYQMLEYANMRLADYASPRISYVLKAMDLSVLTGYEHETWALGDTVMVKDDDLNLSVKTRIVRREYNLQEPWNTVLELSTTLRELGDSSSRWDSAADTLESTDLIDSQEMKDLVPFNHLRNSRADSGLSYWQNSGFTVDADNGVSGTASFKCEGALNTTKSLSQTITPANRQCYTFSAQIASENLSKGTNGQVGIEVTFEYEDGTTETRFIDLI